MFISLSFQVPIKILKFFRDFLSLLSLYFLFYISSELKFDEIENESYLIKNPRHFFNLDCETVFNNFCLLHKACVCNFIDSIPKYVSP